MRDRTAEADPRGGPADDGVSQPGHRLATGNRAHAHTEPERPHEIGARSLRTKVR